MPPLPSYGHLMVQCPNHVLGLSSQQPEKEEVHDP